MGAGLEYIVEQDAQQRIPAIMIIFTPQRCKQKCKRSLHCSKHQDKGYWSGHSTDPLCYPQNICRLLNILAQSPAWSFIKNCRNVITSSLQNHPTSTFNYAYTIVRIGDII